MGNSEIGHTTIGAGKAIDTDLVRIKKAITTGEYDTNPAFTALFKHVLDNGSTLHAQGLIGEGGVHSHSDHLFAFVKAAKKAGIKKVAIHVFTDGRDTPPQSAAQYLSDLEALLEEINDETHMSFVATVSGRFFAMDRDNNWDRLSKVEQALFESKGHVCEIKPSEFLKQLYKDGKVDEHLEVIMRMVIKAGDATSRTMTAYSSSTSERTERECFLQKCLRRSEALTNRRLTMYVS